MATPPLRLAMIAAAVTACSHIVDAPRPDTRTALVEAVLVAGTDVTRFRLQWLNPAGSGTINPIQPEEAALELIHPDGTRADWDLDPDSAGVYLAFLPITAPATYRLAGTLGGRPVSASTRVPGPLMLEPPLGDTLFLKGSQREPGGAVTGRVVIAWRASGATVLVVDSAEVLFSTRFTHGSEADLGVRQVAAGQRVGPSIRFLALNREADRYRFNLTGPETNLSGAFGIFGAASETRRIVVWR